jgi:Uma2 family endonuclease
VPLTRFAPPVQHFAPQPLRWTTEQYHQMADWNWFRERGVELLGGEILEKYPDGPPYPRPWRWTLEQYHQMAELGWFADRRVEFIAGDVIEMGAMHGPHWTSVWLTQKALLKVFKKGFIVPCQLPLQLKNEAEPLPDVMVIEGEDHDFEKNLPTTALLVVEVADSSLAIDRVTKAGLYAAAEIPEYWIINVSERQVEIHRVPSKQSDQPFGAGYSHRMIMREKDTVSPLAAPEARSAVKSLLPRKK